MLARLTFGGMRPAGGTKNLRWLTAALVLSILATACGLLANLSGVEVKGDGMAPTIRDGDRVNVDTKAYASASPARGDIVLIEHAGVRRILRVIGLPGDTVTIEGGAVSVNATRLDEPYLPLGTKTMSSIPRYVIATDCFFLLVDNRARLADSRGDLGACVPRREIVAKVNR